MERDRTEPTIDGESGVWPGWVRYPIIVVFSAIGLVGVITVLYSRGWVPLAGPFVAMVVASTIVFLVMYWRYRRLRRLSADAVQQLRGVESAIAAERALGRDLRPTRAADPSLAWAAEQVERALQRFAWGHEQEATAIVQQLADTAGTSWVPDAPLTEEVRRLARTTAQVDEVIRKMLATAERRRR